jgi:hypothetical protein
MFNNRKKFFEIIFLNIIIFTFLYTLLDINEESKGNKTKYFYYNEVPNNTLFEKISNKFYMSFTTLTTLGFGDIYPIHPLSQFMVAAQTFITFALVTDLVTK